VADTESGQISLNFKDVSDWVKVIVLLAGVITGYVRISDQVAAHTAQIANVQDQVVKMRNENRTRNDDMQHKVGAIEMYLCSKDSAHCKLYDPPPADPPE
jgi:hypothetical protein